jgi:serine-type D-Ala-D-Ala carboxypeptidase/endopeptidase
MPDYLDGAIQNVAVAGEFNDWNPEDEGYELYKIGENVYQLTLPGVRLGKPGEKRLFKFVVNGDTWIKPARQALNVSKDAGGNPNLIIQLDPIPFE